MYLHNIHTSHQHAAACLFSPRASTRLFVVLVVLLVVRVCCTSYICSRAETTRSSCIRCRHSLFFSQIGKCTSSPRLYASLLSCIICFKLLFALYVLPAGLVGVSSYALTYVAPILSLRKHSFFFAHIGNTQSLPAACVVLVVMSSTCLGCFLSL